jgi:hypothetical protein
MRQTGLGRGGDLLRRGPGDLALPRADAGEKGPHNSRRGLCRTLFAARAAELFRHQAGRRREAARFRERHRRARGYTSIHTAWPSKRYLDMKPALPAASHATRPSQRIRRGDRWSDIRRVAPGFPPDRGSTRWSRACTPEQQGPYGSIQQGQTFSGCAPPGTRHDTGPTNAYGRQLLGAPSRLVIRTGFQVGAIARIRPSWSASARRPTFAS